MLNETKTLEETQIQQNNLQNVEKQEPTIPLVPKTSENTECSVAKGIKNILFPDYLEGMEFIQPIEYADEIEKLKLSNDKNFLKMGKLFKRYLTTICENDIKHPLFQNLLDTDNVKIRRTQAIKYLKVYDYCCNKPQNEKSTDELLKLGIEKLYIISMLEDSTKQEKLEEFVTAEKLSVNELEKLTKMLNGQDKILKLVTKFQEKCEM